MKNALLTIAAVLLAVCSFAQSKKIAIETEYGKIIIALYDNTPQHRDNMLKLAKEHTLDSTLWHRVIPQFVIQGGDPDSKHAKAGQVLGEGGLKYTVPAEINDSDYHKRGAVGMARDNNPAKASSSTQFYIVVGKKYTDAELDKIADRTGRKFTAAQREMYKTQGGVPFLDGNYTIFGEVTEGMDVVDKIAQEPRDAHDRPLKDVHLLKVSIVKKKKKFLGLF